MPKRSSSLRSTAPPQSRAVQAVLQRNLNQPQWQELVSPWIRLNDRTLPFVWFHMWILFHVYTSVALLWEPNLNYFLKSSAKNSYIKKVYI